MQNFPLSWKWSAIVAHSAWNLWPLASIAVQYQHNPISVSNPSISIHIYVYILMHKCVFMYIYIYIYTLMLGLESEIGLCWYWTARAAKDSGKFYINTKVNNSVTTCVHHCFNYPSIFVKVNIVKNLIYIHIYSKFLIMFTFTKMGG